MITYRTRFSFGFLSLIAFASALSAQEAPQQRFVEQIEVRVINVDVVVTDKDGKPVMGLNKGDFKLFENGKPVEISYFTPISEGALEAEPGAKPPKAEQSAPTEGELTETVAPRRMTWAVFIDQTHIRPALRNEALQQVKSFLGRAVSEDDRGIVGSFDGVTFRLLNRDHREPKALFAALDAAMRERVHTGPEHGRERTIRFDIQDRIGGPISEAEDAERIADEIQLLIEEEAQQTRNALSAAGSMVDMLTGVDGRVALVYVGAGFRTLPAMTVTEAWRNTFIAYQLERYAPKPEEEEPKLEQEVTALLNHVLATRATMYAIYAADSGPTLFDASNPGNVQPDPNGPPVGNIGPLSDKATVVEMAERTGGRSFKLGPQLDKQLDIVRADMSHYYSLGYTPTGSPDLIRNIKVKLKPEGLRVRYREAALERSPVQQAGDAVVSALFDTETDNPLGVSVETGEPHKVGRVRVLPLKLKIPLAQLTFIPTGGYNRGGLTFNFAAVTKSGALRRLESRELPLDIPAERFAVAQKQHISYAVQLPIETDGTRISISILDSIGQTRSILTVPINKSIQ